MDTKALEEELKNCPIEELLVICETQTDLYSEEERAYILQIIERRDQEEEKALEPFLPESIECVKCGGPNAFSNEECSYCGYPLQKDAYYFHARERALGREEYDLGSPAYMASEEGNGSASRTFHYVISFLIPLVGFIMGAIFLTRESEDEKSLGKTCIIIGIASIVLYAVIMALV